MTPITETHIDIKPGSCPNPVNTGSNGVIPVGLLVREPGVAGTDGHGLDLVQPAVPAGIQMAVHAHGLER